MISKCTLTHIMAFRNNDSITYHYKRHENMWAKVVQRTFCNYQTQKLRVQVQNIKYYRIETDSSFQK